MLLGRKTRENLPERQLVTHSGAEKPYRKPGIDEDDEIAAIEDWRLMEKRGIDDYPARPALLGFRVNEGN